MVASSRTRRGSRGGRGAGPGKRPTAAATPRRRIGGAVRGLVVVALVLFATTDERLFGTNPDGRVLFRTAVAVAELGELGIARGDADAMTLDRPAGDSVSRYGLLPSFALVPAAALAAPFEKRLGPGTSQLFVALHQILLLLLAAAGASRLARALGGDDRAEFRACVATVLSSPLWAYASSDLTEPLQAALVAIAFAAATSAARDGTAPADARFASILAGGAAGAALLTRSLLVLLLPAVLAVLASNGPLAGRRRRVLQGLAGFAPLGLLWGALEMSRFGRLFGGYAGYRFSNPVADGAWRLLIGPNRGLVVFFPLAALGCVGLVRLSRRGVVAALAASVFAGFLLLTAATWWAWDGTVGWGPRLLLPIVPLLAAFAACEAAGWPSFVFRTLFAAGLAVNALGVLESDTAVKTYLSILPPRRISNAEALRYPVWAYERGSDGVALLDPPYWVSREAALSPIRLSAWMLGRRIGGGVAPERLNVPPWDVTRPGLGPVRPVAEAVPAQKLALLLSPFRWPFLGRSLVGRDPEEGWNAAYLDALENQAHRAQDMGRPERAVAFSERLWSLLPTPQTAVGLAESYRLAGRSQSVVSVGDSLESNDSPIDVRYFAVLALLARDLGSDREAADLMAKAADSTSNRELRKWRDVPPRLWPRTLRELTGESRRPQR